MIYSNIAGLMHKGLKNGFFELRDKVYIRNQVMHLLNIDAWPHEPPSISEESIPDILESMVDYAINQGIIEDILDQKEMLTANIMNCFIPRPSIVNETFNKKYQQSPAIATDYFFNFSKNSNYIQMKRLEKNISFKAETVYGPMDITINLSKPEKDPEQIKREGDMQKQSISYPKCLLCTDNEGYSGRIGHPARANHRMVQIPMFDEMWFLQYSPYMYYNEHSILLSEKHRPMKINKETFKRLLLFTKKFPHYFIGSNADLPIVGGSILSHDHYQAGRYTFAMTNADSAFSFTIDRYPNIKASILKWPLSVIRLESSSKEELSEVADDILQIWKNYSDEKAQIKAYTKATSHNTITPIARKRKGVYELDLVLRNNRTSAKYPAGIFHPHPDVHHIKKENIGLIEVMGLAVLPPRLKNELDEVKKMLLGKPSVVADYHETWAVQLRIKYGKITDEEKAEAILQKELGNKFIRVLEDAGVFKEQSAFQRFINALNS